MGELIRQFGIDWRLLLAQVVNFLLLLYLLKRFAYTPILTILRERRKKIEDGLKASEESEKKLAEATTERKRILLKAEEEAAGVVTDAEKTAETQAKSIVAEAARESEHIIASGKQKLEQERLKLESDVEANTHELIRKGLAVTIGKMNPTERDNALIAEALKALKSTR